MIRQMAASLIEKGMDEKAGKWIGNDRYRTQANCHNYPFYAVAHDCFPSFLLSSVKGGM